MRNALAPRLTTSSSPRPRRLRRPGRRLACQPTQRRARPGSPARRPPASPRDEAALLVAASCDDQVRCGLMPDHEARATTVCAPGGGHE
ncbi:hypothetical protein WME91_10535 [Sorangium sp. So ce269]